MSLAILPGSYDPMTLGHLDIVLQAKQDYDEVVVAVMVNAEKCTLFDMETRVEIAKRTVEGISNVRVIADEGMLIDLFDRLGADAVCKGWRNDDDYTYEMQMAEWNKAHNPRFRTVLYRAKAERCSLCSTQVRECLKNGKALDGLVSDAAKGLILSRAKQALGGDCPV